MEKPVKPSKAKMILKFLPKSAAISFQSLPFSPGRDKRPAAAADIKTHCNKGFSGPIISIIPAEARRKSGMDTQEPSSPKVSCIGQIKHKKKMAKQKRQQPRVDPLPTKKDYARSLTTSFQEISSSSAAIGKIFHGRRSDATADSSRLRVCEDAPSLGQMKRFASGRETLSDFNWTTASTATAQVVPHGRKYCLDNDSDDEYEEISIPFSAPMFGGHGSTTLPLEPRKEINLWKRRTMAQPKPLQLNAVIRSK
ncbi:PREDICTED: uncharacterized protein At1g76070-like [Ipomoea nil]|uniref:uncharacterized protein At1g76070-like n=1 Tax=Ipomoea nil TaxID=35883 RepID=UPI0009018280|nr:PREDICTED: uncharacterized protein At1g76070-like [Ipomoea nil]